MKDVRNESAELRRVTFRTRRITVEEICGMLGARHVHVTIDAGARRGYC